MLQNSPHAISTDPHPAVPSLPTVRAATNGTGAERTLRFDVTLDKVTTRQTLSAGSVPTPDQSGPRSPSSSIDPTTVNFPVHDQPKKVVTHGDQSIPIGETIIADVTNQFEVAPPGPFGGEKSKTTKSGVSNTSAKDQPAGKSTIVAAFGSQPVQPLIAPAVSVPLPVVLGELKTNPNNSHYLAAAPGDKAAYTVGDATAGAKAVGLMAAGPHKLASRTPSDPVPKGSATRSEPISAALNNTNSVGLTIWNGSAVQVGLSGDMKSSSASVPAPGTATAAAGQSGAQTPIMAQMSAALYDAGPIRADGSHQLTVALAPPFIGPVTVAINHHADGTASVAISAADPITLSALRNDHAGIAEVLAQVGVTTHEAGLSFQLAPAAPSASSNGSNFASSHHSSSLLSMEQGSAGQQSASQHGAGQSNNGAPNGRSPVVLPAATRPDHAPGVETAVSIIHSANLKRFGLNVTA